jgi:hypothetical protein
MLVRKENNVNKLAIYIMRIEEKEILYYLYDQVQNSKQMDVMLWKMLALS